MDIPGLTERNELIETNSVRNIRKVSELKFEKSWLYRLIFFVMIASSLLARYISNYFSSITLPGNCISINDGILHNPKMYPFSTFAWINQPKE